MIRRYYRYFFFRASILLRVQGESAIEGRYGAVSLLTTLGLINLASLDLVVSILGGPLLFDRLEHLGLSVLLAAVLLSGLHWAALGRAETYELIVDEFSEATSRKLDRWFYLYIVASLAVFIALITLYGFYRPT